MIKIKRTYEPPARGDARRNLVERLWPRGMTLLYSAHDTLHNGAVVLRDYLAERPAERPRGAKHVRQRLTSTATKTKTSSETERTHGSAQQRAR